MNQFQVRCGSCQQWLMSGESIVDSHGDALQSPGDMATLDCGEVSSTATHLFVSTDKLPAFIAWAVVESENTEGDVDCPECDFRLGTFSFVEEAPKCKCRKSVLPPIHVLQGRVEIIQGEKDPNDREPECQSVSQTDIESIKEAARLRREGRPTTEAGSNGKKGKEKRGTELEKLESEDISHDHTCPVCLEVMLNPQRTLPCQHNFCEHCLRSIARFESPEKTRCPLCRTLITECQEDEELKTVINTHYPADIEEQRRKYAGKKSVGPLPDQIYENRSLLSSEYHRLLERNEQEDSMPLFEISIFSQNMVLL